MKTFLGGEGPDDLGRWSKEPTYAEVSDEVGVFEALLRRVVPAAEIVGGHPWKRIPKYRVDRSIRAAEIQNVVGLTQLAWERGAEALVFARDRGRDEDREQDVNAGVEKAREKFPDMKIAGGMAIESLEGWVLAMLGDTRAEAHGRPKDVLAEQHQIRTREEKVRVVERAELGRVPASAASLLRWLAAVTLLATGDDQAPASVDHAP